MCEICAVDCVAVAVKSQIAPDRAPETGSVDREDILEPVVGGAFEYRKKTLGSRLLALKRDVDIESVFSGIDLFPLIINDVT